MIAIAQAIVNGVLAGAALAVPAIAFTTIFAVLRFANFAVAGFATLGAYGGWLVNTRLGVPAVPALLGACVAGGAAAVIVDEAALKGLRRRIRPGEAALAPAIASVAATLLLENVARFLFGNDPQGYDLPVFRDWHIGALAVGPQQLADAAIALVAMTALFLFLGFTRAGRTMRAVADNPGLAALKGIDAARVGRIATFAAGALAGLGGMLIGFDTSLDPLLGFRVMLSVFAAAVVGGLGSIPGAVAGAFVVGLGEEMATLVVDPAYRTAVGFAAILIVLSLRPAGLFGERTA